MQRELTTARLRWRLPNISDLDDYITLVSDYEVVKNLGSWPFPAGRDFTASRCEPYDPARGFMSLVFLGDSMIGGMGLIERELGYMFARPHWGKGFATEMGQAFLDAGFASYDWPDIVASAWADNPPSARVLEKLGFQEVGSSTQFCKARNRDVASRDFVLTRTDWQARDGN